MTSNYDPHNRQKGQVFPGGWELLDFMGPVELWFKAESKTWQTSFYLKPEPVPARASSTILSEATKDRLMIGRRSYAEAKKMFDCTCEIAKHLPYGHPLNRYFHPYKPS